MAGLDDRSCDYGKASYADTSALVEACLPARRAIGGKSSTFGHLESVLFASYLRACWWIDSIVRLKEPHDAQAILHGVRCLYELRFDIVDLKNDPSLLARFLAFDRVSQFAAAEKLVRAMEGSSVVRTPGDDLENRFVNNPANRAEFDSLRSLHFSGKVPRHWHVLTLADRAKAHGKDEEVRYRRLYSKLCAFSHSGLVNPAPTALVNAFCMGNEFAQSLFLGVTDAIAKRFDVLPLIEPAVQEYSRAKKERLSALAAKWESNRTSENVE